MSEISFSQNFQFLLSFLRKMLQTKQDFRKGRRIERIKCWTVIITSLDDNQHKRRKNVFQHENLVIFIFFHFFFKMANRETLFDAYIVSFAFYFFGKTKKIKKIF